jgi:toluene monooxygenase system protein E
MGVSESVTYSLLGARESPPSEYEIVTSRLLYYPGRGFEVNVPLKAFYDKYQSGSLLRAKDWDAFVDPRETTYAKYTRLQMSAETELNLLFEQIEGSDHDRAFSREWLRQLSASLAPVRYPLSGLQMIAAYIAQMAPSGRIAVASLFQAADEQRRIERLAYRMRQLQLIDPELGADSKSVFENDDAWQPLREIVERLLVTFDWGESFVALNLCLKPRLDRLINEEWARAAENNGDRCLPAMCRSFAADAQWHRDWSASLISLAQRDGDPMSTQAIKDWVDEWTPGAVRAVASLARVFTGGTP